MTNKRSAAAGQREGVDAVDRAITMLRCFNMPGEALPLSVLAQRSGLYKSTILRIAGSLIHAGFLTRDGDGRYTLGPELRRLGMLSSSRVSLAPIIRPVLAQLVRATGETASFYVPAGRERICLYRENSPHSARHHLDEGGRHPLRSGAAGLVLAAYGMKGRTVATRELAATGAIVSRGSRDASLSAVAVPIVNAWGEVLGALSVSGLIGRFDQGKIELAKRSLLTTAETLRPQLPRRSEAELGQGQDKDKGKG
jgi:DNA-binding IclR family transcriptional regulator